MSILDDSLFELDARSGALIIPIYHSPPPDLFDDQWLPFVSRIGRVLPVMEGDENELQRLVWIRDDDDSSTIETATEENGRAQAFHLALMEAQRMAAPISLRMIEVQPRFVAFWLHGNGCNIFIPIDGNCAMSEGQFIDLCQGPFADIQRELALAEGVKEATP